MKKASYKRWVRFGLSVGLLAVAFLAVDLGATFAELRGANPRWVLIGLGFTVVSRGLMSFKWNLLLRAKGLVVPYLETLRLYYVSSFLGLLLPATVGSDIARALMLRDDETGLADVASSIIVERLLGFLVLAVLAVPSAVAVLAGVVGTAVPEWVVIGVPSLLGLLSITGLLLSLTGRARALAAALVERLERGRFGGAGRRAWKLFESYWLYREHGRTLAVFCILTVVEIATLIAWYYAAARSVGVEVPLGAFALTVPVITVLVRLPISFAGLGVMQGAFIFFLGLLGVPAEQGLAAGLVAQAIATVAVLPGGAMYGLIPRYRRRRAEAA